MKTISFNPKGITEAKKAQLVRKWIKSKGPVDIIALVEVKASGRVLDRRLLSISQEHFWIHTLHSQGSGGVAVGVHHDLCQDLKGFNIDPNNQWIAVFLTDLTFVGVYANGPQKQRIKTWNSILRLKAPVLIMGDFNMVESLKDRFKARGQAIFGAEKRAWDKVKN